MYEGEHIGFAIDDDGLDYEVSTRGLYTEDVLKGLTESGYKVLDYDGNIVAPDGTNINDLVETPATESELQFIYDSTDQALSEADAVKYFTMKPKEEELQEFAKRDSYSINTRQELIDYLTIQNNLFHLNKNLVDIRPINMITNPDALFTIDEYRNDEAVSGYLLIMERMRTFSCYDKYLEMLGLLKAEGVLNSNNPTQAEVVEAYLHWGIPGFNTKSTKWVIRANDNSDIKASSNKTVAPPRLGYGVMDKEGNIFYRGEFYELEGIDDFTILDAYPVNQNEYYRIYNNRASNPNRYNVIKCVNIPRTDKVMSNVTDTNGYRYSFKADVNTIVIRDNSGSLFIKYDMFKVCLYDGECIELGEFRTKEDYKRYAVMKAFAKTLLDEKTVPSKFDSSYEVAKAAGMSAYTALRFLSYIAGSKDYSKDLGIAFNTIGSVDKFKDGVPYQLLDMLGVDQNDVEELTPMDLVELITVKFAQGSLDGSDLDIPAEYGELVERLRLVSSIVNGDINVGHTAKADEASTDKTLHEVVTIIESAVFIGRSKEMVDAAMVSNLLLDVDVNLEVDVRSVIPMRDVRYKKTLRDLAEYRARKILQSTKLCFIVRTYREVSNGDIGDERDFLMEMYCLDNERGSLSYNTLEIIKEAVIKGVLETTEYGKRFAKADRNNIFNDELQTIIDSAYDIACTIMFKEMLGSSGAVAATTVSVPFAGENASVVLDSRTVSDCKRLAGYLERKYSTLLDFVKYELNESNIFCHYAVNADINPWHVVTRPGFRDIQRYSYGVNFVKLNDLMIFKETFVEKVKSLGVKVNTLRDVSDMDFLIPPMSGFLSDQFDLQMAEDKLLNIDEEESPTDYFNRFAFTNNQAKRDGGYCIAVPLKSDVTLGNFADLDGVDARNMVINSPDLPALKFSFNYFRNFDVINSSYNKARVETKKYYEPFNIDGNYNSMVRLSKLLFGKFKSNVISAVNPTGILVAGANGSQEYKFPLGMSDLEKLENVGVAYRIGNDSYLLHCSGNYYKLEI